MSKIHQNLRKSSTIGFGLFYMTGVIQQRQKRRQMLTCLKEGCDFHTRLYQTERMAIHVASKHPNRPRSKKPHQCRDCKRSFAFPYPLHRHEKTCKMVKVKSKRIVPMVTNRCLLSIKKKYVNVPNRTDYKSPNMVRFDGIQSYYDFRQVTSDQLKTDAQKLLDVRIFSFDKQHFLTRLSLAGLQGSL